MHFTETVHLPGAGVYGNFDGVYVGELPKFSSLCGKAMIAEVKIPVNGALRGGMGGCNLPILRVFGCELQRISNDLSTLKLKVEDAPGGGSEG